MFVVVVVVSGVLLLIIAYRLLYRIMIVASSPKFRDKSPNVEKPRY